MPEVSALAAEDEVIPDIIHIPEQYPTLKHLRISQYFKSSLFTLPPSTIKFLRSKVDTVEVVSDDWVDEKAKPDCTLCINRSRGLASDRFHHDPFELNPSGFEDDNYNTHDFSDPNSPGPNPCFIS